jgi:ABC-type oligopeptide transport system substrate-binding subunit
MKKLITFLSILFLSTAVLACAGIGTEESETVLRCRYGPGS